LDLRIRDGHAKSDGEGDDLAFDSVKISAKQLGSITKPSAMTLSLLNWHPNVVDGIEGQPVFQQLPEHVHGMIQLYRDNPEYEDRTDIDDTDSNDEDNGR